MLYVLYSHISLSSGPGGWSSNGQDYTYFDSGFSPDNQRTRLQQDGVFYPTSTLKRKRHREILGPTRDQKIQIYFNITGKNITFL